MDNDRLIQIREESDSWKRLLDFIQSENTSIKTRIADITTYNINQGLLERAEDFQQRCIRKDELVATLRQDVKAFDSWVGKYYKLSGPLLAEVLDRQRRLRADVKTLSQRFHQLKFSFHDFVSENF